MNSPGKTQRSSAVSNTRMRVSRSSNLTIHPFDVKRSIRIYTHPKQFIEAFHTGRGLKFLEGSAHANVRHTLLVRPLAVSVRQFLDRCLQAIGDHLEAGITRHVE